MEAAAGAAFSGVRSIVSMKHFGVNVASDSTYPLAFYGVKGGMVIVTADDPGCHSSGQSEQDSRWFARIGHMPMLEPSDPQECKDFTKMAFDISEKFNVPVFLRITTRVSHVSGIVTLDKIPKPKAKGKFVPDTKWQTLPPKLMEKHIQLHGMMLQLQRLAENDKKLNYISNMSQIVVLIFLHMMNRSKILVWMIVASPWNNPDLHS